MQEISVRAYKHGNAENVQMAVYPVADPFKYEKQLKQDCERDDPLRHFDEQMHFDSPLLFCLGSGRFEMPDDLFDQMLF